MKIGTGCGIDVIFLHAKARQTPDARNPHPRGTLPGQPSGGPGEPGCGRAGREGGLTQRSQTWMGRFEAPVADAT